MEMLGYVQATATQYVDVTDLLGAAGSAVKTQTTWTTDRGLSRLPDSSQYAYLSPYALDQQLSGAFEYYQAEKRPSGKASVCPDTTPKSPFREPIRFACWSTGWTYGNGFNSPIGPELPHHRYVRG